MTVSHWRKSSFSNGSGGNNCVEVREEPRNELVRVRNSKSPSLSVTFTRAEWEAFIAGVKTGEFD